jgi:hypothetical protein
MRNLHQCTLGPFFVCFLHDALLVVRDVFAGSSEQLGMNEGWEGPRRAAGGCGFVRWELETDKYAARG